MASTKQWHPIIFVLGPPGAGKSYLCKRAAEEMPGVEHVVMSDLLRQEAQRPNSKFAGEINSKLPKGELVSSGATVAAFEGYSHHDGTRMILLDGFPRNLDQARKFRHEIGEAMGTVELTRTLDNVLRRLGGRQRVDDDTETVKRQYRSHINETKPVIDEYLSGLDSPVHQLDSNEDGEGWDKFLDVLSASQCPAIRGVGRTG